jgi:hypothetical protein
MRPERLIRQTVGIQAALLHAPKTAGFHDVEAVRSGLAEELFTILR